MDRRDALKKLGVGGALVVGVPVLLDSFNVASAMSTLPPRNDVVAAITVEFVNNVATITINNPTSIFPTNTDLDWAVITNGYQVDSGGTTATGAIVAVRKTNGNTKNFQVNLIATVPDTSPLLTQTYTLSWADSNSLVVT